MKCPVCGVWTVVKEARESVVHNYRRRRECANGHKFTTEEVVIPKEQLTQERRDRLKRNKKPVVAVRQS
jgi:transcriptional regulator NrdR family protein